MMKTAFYLIILGFILPAVGFPQIHRIPIDSLLQMANELKEDTHKIKVYGDLAATYYSRNPDSFFLFCNKGIRLATALHQKRELAILDMSLSSMLTDTGNYKLSLKYAEEGLALARQIDSKILIVNSYISIGNVYDYQSDFVRSSDYFFRAMTIAQEINDHEKIALIGTDLAATSYNQGDYPKSEKYCLLTLKEAELAHAPYHTYKALYMLGMIRATLKDSIAAKEYYKKSIEVCLKNGFVLNQAEVMSDLANIQKEDTEKLKLLLQVRKIYDTLSPGSFDSRINWESLAETYIRLYSFHDKQKIYLKKAEAYLEKVIAKSRAANDLLTFAAALQSMATVEHLKGNDRIAYEYSNQSHSTTDSVFSQENKNKIAALESRGVIDRKNQEIELQKIQVLEQKKNALIFLSGLLLVSAIGILFYRLSRIRKQKNDALTTLNRELDESNKIKARFFGILSHDLRSPIANLVNYLNLRKLKPHVLSLEKIEERENKIYASTHSLLELMDGILLWSKGQMKNFRPENGEVRIHDLFAYLKRMFPDCGEDMLEFSNDGDLSIETDENYLKTIMLNLTGNAVKALKNIPDPKIQWKGWKENDQLFLSITDNGPGIDNEKMKALYDETVASGSKYGLGLHIIRDLAKSINCKIEMRPAPGQGTVFELMF